MNQKPNSIRSVGLIGATSVVVGTMIGSGILVISSKISVFGGIGLLAWVLSSLCAMSLAYSFSVMSRKFKEKSGIPYYVYSALNNKFIAFQASWAHWLGMTIGCGIVAIAFADYLFFMIPENLYYLKIWCSIGAVWLLTFMNIRSSIFSVGLITLITFLKIVLLTALIISSLKYFSIAALTIPSTNPSFGYSLLEAMPLALFAFLGLESATASGDSVKNPEKTLPIATLLGTLIASFMFVAVHMSVMSVLPFATQINSSTPVADVAFQTIGKFGVMLISFIACFGLIGSINSLIFVSSYILFNASSMGWISSKLQRLSKKAKFPTITGILSSIVITIIILIYNFKLIDINTLVYIDAFLLVFVYLLGTIAYKIHKGNYIVFAINTFVCLLLMYGCGLKKAIVILHNLIAGNVFCGFLTKCPNAISLSNPVLFGIILLITGTPIFLYKKYSDKKA